MGEPVHQCWLERETEAAGQSREEIAMATADELWGRVQAAEAEEQAALDRYEAFRGLNPTSEWSEEYEAARGDAGRAWARAEEARHELDRLVNPRRYAKKGYRAEALDRFRRQAEADDPEIEAGS
jgi:hypothetical protein